MSNEPIARVRLEDGALEFVHEELHSAAVDFDGALAGRLLKVRLTEAFGFISQRGFGDGRPNHYRQGGVDDGQADTRLANAISRWIAEAGEGKTRILLLEDPLAKASDPAPRSGAWHFGDRVYFYAGPGDGVAEISKVMARPAGFPGIGVLSEVASERFSGPDLSEDSMDAVVGGAFAVLVRAWDDEAFVVACTSSNHRTRSEQT